VFDSLPLSPRFGAESAGEPTWPDVLAGEGFEDSDDAWPDLLDTYSYAYATAAEDEIVITCPSKLGLFPTRLPVGR
jgi:hypothetical protein